jgi:N-acetylglucosamine-6-phosphate deacetylase
MYTIVNCRLATRTRVLQDRWVSLSGNRIEATGSMKKSPPTEGDVYDAQGGLVSAGFIDMHIHGYAGHSFSSGKEDDVRAGSVELAKTGTTSFLATVPAMDRADTQAALEAIREVMVRPEPKAARVLGVHLEGPYLNPDAAGAQDAGHIRPIDLNEVKDWLLFDSRLVKMMTFAPELDGAEDLIRQLARHGVVPAMGHTSATYDETLAAIDAGAWYCTHVFNAMKRFHHRDPGPLAAIFAREHVHCEYIADGVHSHPGALQLLVQAKGCDRTLLVSDATTLAGTDGDKQASVAGRTVTVSDGTARTKDGTLAGSVRTIDYGLRFAFRTLSEEESKVLRMTAMNQARVLAHEEEMGEISPGMTADLVVLDPDLRVTHVVVGGKPVEVGSGAKVS